MSKHQDKTHIRNNQHVDSALPLYTNEELLATTCLFLACKATEVPRKVRDLVNVGYRYYHPDEEILQVDEMYFKMRSSLATSELLLVRALDCNLELELPFSFALNVLRNMGSISYFHTSPQSTPPSPTQFGGYVLQKEIWKRMEKEMPLNFNVIARLTWMFVWDSLCSPKITLKHAVPEVALGCLYLALRTSYANIQMTMSEWVDRWGASDNISVQAVRDVALDLLEIYDQSSISLDKKHFDSLPTSSSVSPLTDTDRFMV
ncbi:hypothetical protein BC941DRAFT_435970 [Chlamydoabsidia padenii]|nr:hypothetical protein BC941DRAFT_435970 [Chlamydoabsidia padenii]